MKDTTERRLDVAINVTEEAHELRPRIEQPDESIDNAWRLCWAQMQAEDATMIGDWKSQTRDLMFVASIFSCAITIFTSKAMGHPNFPYPGTGTSRGSPPGGWPNFFRASSLALSYLTVIVCIGMRSWLQSYTEPQAMTARDRVQLRQAWYTYLTLSQVPAAIRAQPYMLQAALALFIAGLQDPGALALGALFGSIMFTYFAKWFMPWFISWAIRPTPMHIPRPVSTPSISSIDPREGIFDWLHKHRPHCSDTDEIIASCAWTEELPIFLRLIKKYGEHYPWAYGNAIISAIHFERDCQCGQTADSPSCSNVHLPDLVEALNSLSSWSAAEDSHTDPRRRAGWHCPATYGCGAMIRILLDERTRDAAIVHTDQFQRFLAQQTEIVEKLCAADKWCKYFRWPNMIHDLAVVQPACFEASLGAALRDVKLPEAHDNEDVEVHRLLVAAGTAICAYHDSEATENLAHPDSRPVNLP